MDLITFFYFYHVFSAIFMCGFVSEMCSDETNHWIIFGVTLIALILAPILFPLNLGKTIAKHLR